MNVLRGDIAQVDAVNLRAGMHIKGHSGERCQVIQGQGGIPPEGFRVRGFPGEGFARGQEAAVGVDLRHLLHHLKEPGPPGNAVGFQGGGHCQAYGFLRPAGIGYHEMGGQGVQPPLHALHGGIKGF